MIQLLNNTQSPLLYDTVNDIFKQHGHLETALGMEYRKQQSSMALASASAFDANSPLLFEAGTGVGKSLAYLIPGLIHAINTKRTFIVSTHTKALQEQIESNDLATCRRLFEAIPQLQQYANFKVGVLMGKANYLCTSRLAHAITTRTELFTSDTQNELERIVDWSGHTQTGLREELGLVNAEVWDWVNADSSSCNRRSCDSDSCFYRKAKAKLKEANIIIVNHSLLFALLGSGMGAGQNVKGVLYPNDFLVIDEAHTMPDIATDHFGLSVSRVGIERLLKMLYNPKRDRGLIKKYGTRADCGLVVKALAATEEFFNLIHTNYLRDRSTVRLHEAPWVDPIICSPLTRLIDRLGTLINGLEFEKDKEALSDQRKRLNGYYSGLMEALALEPSDYVHWVERSGKRGHNVTIRTAPIDVAKDLREVLFTRDTSVVQTSATLTTLGSMETFKSRIGGEHIEEGLEASPFDYEANTNIYVVKNGPMPERSSQQDSNNYIEFITNAIGSCVERVAGGSLVLFTSYNDMRQVSEAIEERIQSLGRELLIQGEGLTRMALVQRFKAAGNAVLFGTDSFWTGVDVPGPALSQVILTRLPFENPSHPIKEARGEWLERQGTHPFVGMTLPEAVIKFRQGIGRLIRTKEDRGVITVLDSRILRKEYGKYFLGVLPKRSYSILNL